MDFILVNSLSWIRMKDGSGNFYVVQRNKRLQRTAWRCCNGVEAGACSKKTLMMTQKDLYLCCKENYWFLLRLCLLFRWHLCNLDIKTCCREARNVNVSHRFVTLFKILICCRNKSAFSSPTWLIQVASHSLRV
jgi:hypothetical protein